MVDGAAIEVATVMVAELEYVRNVQSFTVVASDGARAASTWTASRPAPSSRRRSVRQLGDLRRTRDRANRCRSASTTPPASTVLAHVADVAGFGWTAWTGGVVAGRSGHASTDHGSPTGSSRWRSIRPTAPSPSTATRGLGRLVDGGDVG